MAFRALTPMKVEQSPSLKKQVESNLNLKDRGYLAPMSHYCSSRTDLRKGDRHADSPCKGCYTRVRKDRPHKKCTEKLEKKKRLEKLKVKLAENRYKRFHSLD